MTEFLNEFYACIDTNDIVALDRFIAKYIVSSVYAVKQFAHGLKRDLAAVRNCLLYPHISNGITEGNNSRTKCIHRRGGGRASIELLNAYRVLTAFASVA